MGNPLVFDENFHVYVGPYAEGVPADPTAPTMDEISAMTDITEFIRKDGFNPGVSNNRVTGGNLKTSHTPENMGTWTSQLQVTIERHTPVADDDAYTLLGVRGSRFTVIATPFGPAAPGEPAYVWPNVQVGQPIPQPTAENQNQAVVIDMAVGSPAPEFSAVIAA